MLSNFHSHSASQWVSHFRHKTSAEFALPHKVYCKDLYDRFTLINNQEKILLLHYGRFGQNLSKNSRDLLFDKVWLFLIPMVLKSINKAIEIEKGQQIFQRSF